MKNYIIAFALILLNANVLVAQEELPLKKARKIQFTSYQNFGLQYDGQSATILGDLSAGIKTGKMAFMVGSGISGRPALHHNTYADVRYYIGKKQRFFTLANVGFSRWLSNNWNTYLEGDTYGYVKEEDRKNKLGLHLASGIGASALIGKELKYNIALVYSYTQLQYSTLYYLPSTQQETAIFNFNKLQWGLRLGLSF